MTNRQTHKDRHTWTFYPRRLLSGLYCCICTWIVVPALRVCHVETIKLTYWHAYLSLCVVRICCHKDSWTRTRLMRRGDNCCSILRSVMHWLITVELPAVIHIDYVSLCYWFTPQFYYTVISLLSCQTSNQNKSIECFEGFATKLALDFDSWT